MNIEYYINKLPLSLYSGGLYMKYDKNGLWYVGYQNSVHHASDKDLLEALSILYLKLKNCGYETNE